MEDGKLIAPIYRWRLVKIHCHELMWSGIHSQALGRYNKLYPFQPANQSAAQCSMLVSSSTCYYYIQHCIHWQVFSHFTQWAHSHLDNLAILH